MPGCCRDCAIHLRSRCLAGSCWPAFCGWGSAFAAEARIAVAANFRDTAEAIAAQLEAESPHRYEVIAGSTGKLASQILNGAPYDVFMAADRQRPQLLVDRGLASATTQQIYAVGELACGGRVALAPRPLKPLPPSIRDRYAWPIRRLHPMGRPPWAMLQSTGLASWLEGVVRVDNVNLVLV